jgi:hypothetical protein
MRSTARIALTLIAAGAALGVAACGGGGSSPSTPRAAAQSPKSTVTAPPTAANRKAVGTASLTLVLPTILHGKSGAAVRARVPTKGATPKFIDPASGSVLDIWVDGTLVVPQLPITVAGTQGPIAIPLYSTDLNQISVFEYESDDTTLLAIGEFNLGGFTPGTSPAVNLSLYQNTTQLGIIDLPAEQFPSLVGGSYAQTPSCTPGNPPPAQFGVFPADANGNFIANAGSGGVQPVSLSSQSSDVGGSSTITAQILLPGFYQLVWDIGMCTGVTATFTVYNQANFIYSDANIATGTNAANYATGFNAGVNGTTNGPNQGIWNLIYGYALVPESVLDQASTGLVSGTVDITNS